MKASRNTEITICNNSNSSNNISTSYDFEWHDSILIKSIIRGEYIILDNVNTCSSSVLDRLNSLLDDDNLPSSSYVY